MRLSISVVVSTLLLASVIACGSGTPEPVAPTAPSATPAPAGEPQAVPSTWSAATTKEQQVAFMKKNVEPRMAKVFQTADATHYAQFGCKTCHGPEFKQPKEFLPRLTLKDGKLTAFADKPEVAKFMAEHVVPEMASAMGEPAYDPTTHKGFGCGGCHGIDMK